MFVFSQALTTETLTLEQQLAQYPLFNQLTAQAQAQLLSDLQKQQQALSQGIQLITLPTLASPGTATASSPSPDSQSQTTASISISSVSEQKGRHSDNSWFGDMTATLLLILKCHFSTWLCWKFFNCLEYIPVNIFTSFHLLLGYDTDKPLCRITHFIRKNISVLPDNYAWNVLLLIYSVFCLQVLLKLKKIFPLFSTFFSEGKGIFLDVVGWICVHI